MERLTIEDSRKFEFHLIVLLRFGLVNVRWVLVKRPVTLQLIKEW